MKEIIIPYEAQRKFIKTGDTILWKSKSLLGWLIRKFSKSDVNHAALVIRVDEIDRVFVMEALEHGIIPNSLTQRIKEFKGEVYWLPLQKKFDVLRPAIGQWGFDKAGIEYDYPSILKQTVVRVEADDEKLFCSEFDFMAKRDGGKIPSLQGMKVAPRPGDMEGLNIYDRRIRIK